MVVVSVCLAAWIGIVWWQDRRTMLRYGTQGASGGKLEEDIEMPEKAANDTAEHAEKELRT